MVGPEGMLGRCAQARRQKHLAANTRVSVSNNKLDGAARTANGVPTRNTNVARGARGRGSRGQVQVAAHTAHASVHGANAHVATGATSALAAQHGDAATRTGLGGATRDAHVAAVVGVLAQTLGLTTNQVKPAAIAAVTDVRAAACASNNTHLASLPARAAAQARGQKHVTANTRVSVSNNKLDGAAGAANGAARQHVNSARGALRGISC